MRKKNQYFMKFYMLLFILCIIKHVLYSAEWTLFVYMGADNDLHQDALDDIVEMQKGLLVGSHHLEIIVYIDHIPQYKNGVVEYIQISPSNKNTIDSRIIRTMPDENSGSGESLTKFLNWAYPRYASKKNMLSLWSHSSGWSRDIKDARWIIEDSTSESNIKVYNGELHDALAKHGKTYDIIILDACNAGSIEMISEIKDFTHLAIASPDLFPASGYPWTEIISGWVQNLNSYQVSELMVSCFINAYSIGGVYNPNGISDRRVSIAVYDMKHYDKLFDAIKIFSDTFVEPVYSDILSNIRRSMPHYLQYNWGYEDIDLLYFAEEMTKISTILPINTALNFYDTINEFVYLKSSLQSLHHHSISIWYPHEFRNFIEGFKKYWHFLKFSTSGWGRFLNYAYGNDSDPPDPVQNVSYKINLETIYIDWEIPIDPTLLTFQVDFFDQNNIFIENRIIDTNNISKRVHNNGFFTIKAIDEAGNISVPIEQAYSFIPTNKDHFYIAPNPVNIKKKDFIVFYYLTKSSSFLNISLYNISGQLVWELKTGFNDVGEYNIKVENLPVGVYFGVLDSEHSRIVDKFAVVR